MKKINKHTIDIELLKMQCAELHKAIKSFYETLNKIELDNSIIYIKNSSGQNSIIKNPVINDISIINELVEYIKANAGTRIDNFYSKFSDYLFKKHDIVLKDYVTAQKIGVLVASIDTSDKPFTILNKRGSQGRYYIIESK